MESKPLKIDILLGGSNDDPIATNEKFRPVRLHRPPPAPQPTDSSFKKIDVNALVRETLAKKGIGLNG
jgi:hypothetical protein